MQVFGIHGMSLPLNQWVQGSSPWEDTKGYPKGYPFFVHPYGRDFFVCLYVKVFCCEKNIQ